MTIDYCAYTPQCTQNHPPLQFKGVPGVIFGSSCVAPIVEADLYISLDKAARPLPGKPHIFHYIEDFSIPIDVVGFDNAVDCAIEALHKAQVVHVGCLAGHGRTGMFLAALTYKITGQKNAIDYVREKYCHKAVETQEQISFLHSHYGIKEPSKS